MAVWILVGWVIVLYCGTMIVGAMLVAPGGVCPSVVWMGLSVRTLVEAVAWVTVIMVSWA